MSGIGLAAGQLVETPGETSQREATPPKGPREGGSSTESGVHGSRGSQGSTYAMVPWAEA